MKKEKFLELASQLFDQSTNLKEEEKIQAMKKKTVNTMNFGYEMNHQSGTVKKL